MVLNWQVKDLFEQVLNDWYALTDAEEIKIIQNYANKGRLFTICAGLLLYFGILFFTVLFFIPDVLDIVAPLNKPRQHQLPFVIEPLFDLEEHFLFFILNFLIISFVILTILLTVETLYMICIQHACGLLKLTRYSLSYTIFRRYTR
ncbi:hypothetical protein ALC62_03634 [Cyphomyrmex costatus]|uniref:Uncharacterized protein n=1 Tax=Cyphomyrmex costatus TaxID=456900 RepID=A0A195CYY8_9HYME|nr:hypothetical protein ALC62_03634 [Cyphomyrmex costatus]